jgi:hypothetical protein
MSEERTFITLQDISLVIGIIDVVVKRGAIEGNELSTVGGIRDKLDRFIKENTPTETETETETEEPATVET